MAGIPAVGQDVERLLRLVQRRAPNAQVVLVSYPQMVPTEGSCAELPFAAGDYAYVSEFFVAVDGALRAAPRGRWPSTRSPTSSAQSPRWSPTPWSERHVA